MEKILCVIQGFFWNDDPMLAIHTPFVGKIMLDDDNKFQGFTYDDYGRVIITGEIKEETLEFTKVYDPNTRGSKGPIHYLLHAQKTPDNGKILCRGWKGTYDILQSQRSPSEGKCGETTCIILPLPK